MLDIPAVVKVAQRHRVLTMIDATLATPYNIRPLELGVDIVIHSATKYLGGHNDLLAGVTLGGHKLLEDLNKLQRMIGSIAGPLSCFLLERGLKTFPLRMDQHNRAGLLVAQALEKHPKVEKVWYPGLKSHPDYAIAKAQMRGFGSVISFLVKGDDRATRRFQPSRPPRTAHWGSLSPSLSGPKYARTTRRITQAVFSKLNKEGKDGGQAGDLMWEKLTWNATGKIIYRSSWSWKP